jgi:glycosyltransferase involved in cell wall biosynthesis
MTERAPDDCHVAILIPSFEMGGFQSVFVALANGLSLAGVRTTVLTFDPFGPKRASLNPKVTVAALASELPGWGRRLLTLSRWLKSERPDAFLSGMSSANCLAICARMLGRAPGIRLVISEHNSMLSRVQGGDRRAIVSQKISRALYPRADALVAVSKGVARETEALNPTWAGRTTVIYNPVVDEVLADRLLGSEAHPVFDDPDVPVVCGMSRLVACKNYPLLIRAFLAFKARTQSKAKLAIIGEGPERPALERLISEHDAAEDIMLLGERLNPIPLIAKADLFVHPSSREGFGNVIVEALAAGTPVIATDCPNGPAEILENGKWGRLTPMNDEAALSKAIEDCLSLREKPDPASIRRFRSEDIVAAYRDVLFPAVRID